MEILEALRIRGNLRVNRIGGIINYQTLRKSTSW